MLRKFDLVLVPVGLSALALIGVAATPNAALPAVVESESVETAVVPDGTPDDEILLAGNFRRGFGGHHGFGGFKKRHRHFDGFEGSGGFKSFHGRHGHFGRFGGHRR